MDDLEYGSWALDFGSEGHVCCKAHVMKLDGDTWKVDLPATVFLERSTLPSVCKSKILELKDVEKKLDAYRGISLISVKKLLSEGLKASWDEGRRRVEYKDAEGNVRLMAYNDWNLFGWGWYGMCVRVTPVQSRKLDETA